MNEVIKISKDIKLKELEDFIVNEICKIACKFYKEGEEVDEEEKLDCGSFKIIRHQLEKGIIDRENLKNLAKIVSLEPKEQKGLSEADKFLVKNFCKIACGFYTEHEHGEGDEYLQCGGYKIIRHQLKTGMIDRKIIKKMSKNVSRT